MKRKLLLVLVTILAFSLCLTACGDKKVTGIVVVDGTLTREYELNSTPDFSGIQAEIKYNDGSTEKVGETFIPQYFLL